MQPDAVNSARSIAVAVAVNAVALFPGAVTIGPEIHSRYSIRETEFINAVAWSATDRINITGAWTTDPTQLAPEIVITASKLIGLRENWNSYGASPVNRISLKYSLQLLGNLMRSNTPVPWLIPTSAGGIQIEWHTRDIDLEVRIDKAPTAIVFFEDAKTGETWEGELGSNVQRLTSYVALLSNRV